MGKLLFVVIFMAFAVNLFAEEVTITTYYPAPEGVYHTIIADEIGIGTPDPEAIFEVNSTDDGILIPRMTWAEREGIYLPPTSLLIYQTDDYPPDDPAGYCYNKGTPTAPDWRPLLFGGGGGGWLLEGNTGTDPLIDFIGTIDNEDWVVRTNDTERMRVKNTGNVGIGTTDPGDNLHISGWQNRSVIIGETGGNFPEYNSYLGFGARVDSAAPTNQSIKKINFGEGGAAGTGGALISATHDGNMRFRTFNPGAGLQSVDPTNTVRMTILNNGNVGIGTTNPTNTLNVVSDSNLAASAVLRVVNTNSTGANTTYAIIAENAEHSSREGILSTATACAVRGDVRPPASSLTSGVTGVMGVATSIPNPDQDATGVRGIAKDQNGCAGVEGTLWNSTGGGLIAEGMLGYNSASTGKVAIYGHDVLADWAGYFDGDVKINGLAYCTNGNWAGSDLRLKKNIENLDGVLGKLKDINPVKFDWRKDEFPDKNLSSERQIGLIAQEVEEVFPELITTDNGGYKGLAYDRFTAVLLEAIKEQQKQIEDLNKKIVALETKLK